MVWFVISLILVVAGILCLTGGAIATKAGNDGLAVMGAGVAALVIGIVVMGLSTIREVPTKSVGVPTSFGRVEPPLLPGLHWFKAPWTKVNILPTTIQTTVFSGSHLAGDRTGSGHNCLPIRIGGQQQACLNITIQWQVKDAAAPSLFNDYNTAGADILSDIRNAVVVRELEQAVNFQMGDYNPIEDVAANATAGNSQFSTFQPKVFRQMAAEIGGRVKVLSIIMPSAIYAGQTQARLESIQAQYADTAIAKQEIVTNEALNEANRKLEPNVNPNVLEAQCLNITQMAVKTNFHGLPPGWNCTGGSPLALSTK